MSSTPAPKICTDRSRPTFPKRAIITGGMPYGNKDLHFGHVGGVFVQADAFARFLRDRIGNENVIFVSGTDCYGSPIVEEHRGLVSRGAFDGSLEDFVTFNHKRQKDCLDAYQISLNLFAASGLEPHQKIHQDIGALLLETLHKNGHLEKRTTLQFYDPEREVFLNGRQVQGQCPIEGCRSEKAYADECSLGHQYDPKDLINPKSMLTGQKPEMRDVTNWYINLPAMRDLLKDWVEDIKASGTWRPFIIRSMEEYFEPPIIHVHQNQAEELAAITPKLPPHTQQEGRAKSIQVVFSNLEDLETARALLGAQGIRYRTGKTLVPFRLTGNLDWGLPAPDLEDLPNLTFWVWPESLWAPISFSASYLKMQGGNVDDWKDWWCSQDTGLYQFIGEDNVFFYSLPEVAMFRGMAGKDIAFAPKHGELQLPHLVANRHVLFLDKKASSSSDIKPPMARDLLNFYTSDQLRTHFLSLGLSMRSVSFRPKPLNPKAKEKEGDPVLKEANLLSNTFNRAVRSCFYTAQKFFEGRVPIGDISEDVIIRSEETILDFEAAMYTHEFQQAIDAAGRFIRDINQRWNQKKPYNDDCDPDVRQQALIDAFHMVRVAITLMHPVAPTGTERVRDYLNLDASLWSWDNIFEPLYAFMENPETHALKFLEPRVDFFEKHPSQVPPRA